MERLGDLTYSGGTREMTLVLIIRAQGLLVQTLTVKFSVSGGNYIVDISHERTGLSTLTDQFLMPQNTNTYLSMFYSMAVTPSTGLSDDFWLNTVFRVDYQNIVYSYKSEDMYSALNFWAKAIFTEVYQECKDVPSATDCSGVADFGLTLTGRGSMPGYHELEDFNPIYGDQYPAAELLKCWVPQYWDQYGSINDVRCNFCKSIRARNADGTLLFGH